MKIHIIEKARKSIAKNCKSIFYKTVNQFFSIGSQHNSMTEMCPAIFNHESEGKIGLNNLLKTC